MTKSQPLVSDHKALPKYRIGMPLCTVTKIKQTTCLHCQRLKAKERNK